MFPLAECILEALCYVWNATTLYLMRNMSCSYSTIATYRFDLKALSYTPKVLCRKRFRDDIFVIWNHSLQELHKFFEFMNSIDTSGKIKFTVSVANINSVLRVSGFKLTYK